MNEIPTPAAKTNDPHEAGKRLLSRGLLVYYALAGLGVIYALCMLVGILPIVVPFGPAGAIAVAVCFLIAPSRLRAGSDGWRSFTQLFGLLLALVSLGGGFAVANSSTLVQGILSLIVFLLSCYLVKVFGQSMEVAAYLAHLRQTGKKHGEPESGGN